MRTCHFSHSLLVFALAGLLMAGCAGGSQGPVSLPDSGAPAADPVVPSSALQVTHEFAGAHAGTGLTGLYEVEVDAAALSASLTPVRTAEAIGDTFDVDLTTILRSAPCGDCLQVQSLKLKENNVVAVTFQLAHPFRSLEARKDLHVFDVRGHLISGRSIRTFPGVTADLGSGTPQVVGTNAGLVQNADGYSTFFDGVVEGFLGLNIPGNNRPYKLFWRDLGPGNVNPNNPSGWNNVDAPRGHNVFPMGGTASDTRATATYDLALVPGETSLNFLFMVDASYGQSATRPTRLEPRYFVPLFNQPAPVLLSAEILQGDLFAGDPTSSILVEVKVGDWQAGLQPPDLGFDPDTAKLNDIAYASDLSQVLVHIPGVLNAAKTQSRGASLDGTGKPNSPYRFQFTLENEANAVVGDYFGIVKALDEASLEQTGPVGLQRDAVTPQFSYKDFNTYQLFPVSVGVIPNLPPVAQIVASRTTVPTGGEVEFCPGPLTNDPDGQIVLWEYDYDWDGEPANFAADAIRTPADASKCATTTFTNDGEEPVQVRVALRVTDNGNPSRNAIDSLEITIAPYSNEPPVAVLTVNKTDPMTGEEITFQPGPGTSDPDGSIVLYEYDFDWDGDPSNFEPDVAKTDASPVLHTYVNPGTDPLPFRAALRVTDDGDPELTAIGDVMVTVQPTPPNQPPTAELLSSRTTARPGQTVSFWPGPGTGDPDGAIALYEYDFDWDGDPGTFSPDVSRTDTNPVNHIYSNPGTTDLVYRAALRVTDDGDPELSAIDDLLITVTALSGTPIWDFEDPTDTLGDLGFTLLGTNGLERGPIAPCTANKQYSADPPSSYNAPPPGSTWGLVEGIGNSDYPGNSTARALEESGSTAAPGSDNRYWTDAIYAIRSPLIPLPNNAGKSYYLDLHHWFQTDFEYEVDAVPPGIPPSNPFNWAAMPNPGKVTYYDGGTVWVREAPGGVPSASATRLDVMGTQATEPYWATFNNAMGYRWEMTSLFFMEPFPENANWLSTNYQAGVDKGFSGMSYTSGVTDRRAAVPDGGQPGGWRVNPAPSEWLDSRFDLTPWAGKEIVLEFRFASKKKDNPGCRTVPVGTTIYPPCIECMQNLEALTDTSVNHRRSKGWKIDRIQVKEE